MNKNDFISLVEQPAILGKSHITALKNIAADFPYFQTAQLLLTKALYNEKHYEFEKQLKYASVMLPDRSVLFKYLHSLAEELAVGSPIAQPTVLVEEELLLKEEPSVGNPQLDKSIDELIIGTPQLSVSAEGIVVEEQSEKPPYSEVITSTQEDTSKTETIEPFITNEVDEVVSVAHEIVETEKISTTENAIIPTEESPTSSFQPPKPNNQPLPENGKQQTESTELHSFSEWLQLQQNAPIEFVEEKKTERIKEIIEKEELIPEIPTSNIQPPVINSSEETAYLKIIEASEKQELQQIKIEIKEEINKSVERSNINEFESILDRFIRENPRITRGKAEFYNPQNMAKQSVQEDDELVTETLANMYYKQGHYKKAIRAYEKLCLIYPHKLTYFASLIQKIKTENKD